MPVREASSVAVRSLPWQFQPAVAMPPCGVQLAGLARGRPSGRNAPAGDVGGDRGRIDITGLAHAGQIQLAVVGVSGGRALRVQREHFSRGVVVLPRDVEGMGGGRGCLV